MFTGLTGFITDFLPLEEADDICPGRQPSTSFRHLKAFFMAQPGLQQKETSDGSGADPGPDVPQQEGIVIIQN